MNKEISFIIPLYNKNIQQLTKCVKSIQKLQQLSYEIIIINDGSTILKDHVYRKFAQKYKCKYFFQKNKGVSSARNFGIEKAIGDYLFFVDADDSINAKSIKLQDLQEKSDLIIYDVEVRYNNGEKALYKLDSNPSKVSILKSSLNNGIMNWSVSKLYSKKYLLENDIFFDEDIYSGEDFDFITRIIASNPSMSYIPKVAYFYLIDENTSKNRILKHPLESLNDEIRIYKRRLEITSILDESKDIQENLSENAIKAIFEVYKVLVKYSISNAKIYNRIFSNEVVKLANNNSNLSKVTKLKILLIKNKKYFLINTYSFVRNIYKKTFKKNQLI